MRFYYQLYVLSINFLFQIDTDESLSFIDSALISAGEFLKKFALDSQIKECFNSFVECPKIVDWIRTLGDKESSLKSMVKIHLCRYYVYNVVVLAKSKTYWH